MAEQKTWQHHWYPCSQIKDFEVFPPIRVHQASGGWLFTEQDKLFDATSSWWCKHLGHRHPKLVAALQHQSDQLIHSIGANTASDATIELSYRLAQLTPHLDKVFYAGDGSCAVEIALKMALHAKQLLGETQRTQVLKLAGAYHGETIMAMAVSDCDVYKAPYQSWMLNSHTVQQVPYVDSTQHPLWHDASKVWAKIEQQISPLADECCAVIVEPLLQGANHMKMYSQDFLSRLAHWAKRHGVYLIADEIMTGFWRTGSMLACQQADIQPDFICLGKGLTSGMLPISAVLAPNEVFELFYGPKEQNTGFLHSHTFSGHALSAAVANAALEVYATSNMAENVEIMGQKMLSLFQQLNGDFCCFKNIRQFGGVVAAELNLIANETDRLGWQLQQLCVQHGVLLRPLGHTVYWCPPLNSSSSELEFLAQATAKGLVQLKAKYPAAW